MIHRFYKYICSLAICSLLATQMIHAYTQVHNNIQLEVHDYATKQGEILVYANNPIIAGQFLQKGMHPVRLTITNNSDNPIIVSSKSLFKEQVDSYQAARKFHLDNQFTSSLILDYYLLTIGINTLCGGIPGIISIVLPIIPPGSIIAAIYYFHTRSKNKAITQALEKLLTKFHHVQDAHIVKPGSSITNIILLKEDYKMSQFTFRVFDEENKVAASFAVTLD